MRCSVVVMLIIAASLVQAGCLGFVCENTSQKEVASPDGKLRAVIFDRGCGATVGFITAISILPIRNSLSDDDAGNTLFAEEAYQDFYTDADGVKHLGKVNFDVEWLSSTELLVTYSDPKDQNSRNVGDVTVTFKKLLVQNEHRTAP